LIGAGRRLALLQGASAVVADTQKRADAPTGAQALMNQRDALFIAG
jgi:hypothetical protein